jgi:hypothetical protein
MSNSDKPLAVPLSAGLGPLPAVPFCRVRDVLSTSMAMTLRQEPEGGLFTAAQMDAERQRCYALGMAEERERWVTACCAAYADAMGRSGRERTAAADAVMAIRRACGA